MLAHNLGLRCRGYLGECECESHGMTGMRRPEDEFHSDRPMYITKGVLLQMKIILWCRRRFGANHCHRNKAGSAVCVTCAKIIYQRKTATMRTAVDRDAVFLQLSTDDQLRQEWDNDVDQIEEAFRMGRKLAPALKSIGSSEQSEHTGESATSASSVANATSLLDPSRNGPKHGLDHRNRNRQVHVQSGLHYEFLPPCAKGIHQGILF